MIKEDENVSKIRVEINPTTNYIFHMLSIAGVGYDNDYGRRYRSTVPESDLAVLKAHERQLSVKGGEYGGEWYGDLVCLPARADVPADVFYRSVTDPAMAEVCRVMAAHYQAYVQQVYPETLQEMQPYADDLQRLLEESDLFPRAESLVGTSLPCFRVMLVNSVAGGADAIDIGPEQDVFGIGRPLGAEMHFIGHEYIIYLLKQALAGTAAFCTYDTWSITEGLAEYYMVRLCGEVGFFRQMEKEIAFYQSLPENLDAREMFLRASAWALVKVIAREYGKILGDNLVGVYVHGSMAFGCFAWAKSDIDFLVVVQSEPAAAQKQAMLELLMELDAFAPEKGFEMSVVLAEDCAAPQHPIPFALHYSNAHRESVMNDPAAYIERMKGRDPDLAAHFTVIRAAGSAVWGRPIAEVFGPVPREAYLDSILADVASAAEDVAEEPVYVILNLCRVLAAVQEGAVLSKAQGGAWALDRLPQEHRSVVQAALHAYETGSPCSKDGAAFVRYMLNRIKEA